MPKPISEDLTGKLTIVRVSRFNDSEIHIELEDQAARVRAFQVRLSLHAFAEAITGMGAIPCVFNYSPLIGTTGENKTEMVPVPPYGQRPDGWQDQALAPFCVDGWWPRQDDITNHHCSFSANGQHYQKVAFFRNVQKGEAANAQTSSETQD